MMQDMDIENLRNVLKKHGMSQTDLARLLGRDKAVVTNLFSGKRSLKAEEAMLIARHLGVDVAQILGEKPAAQKRGMEEPAVLIPFRQAPLKTKKSKQIVEKSGKFFLKDSDVTGANVYAVEVRDDSLNLLGFMPGDIVISDLDAPCKPGQVVVVQYYKGAGAETLLRKFEPPLLMAHSTSQAHKPLNVDKDNVRLVSPVIKLIRSL